MEQSKIQILKELFSKNDRSRFSVLWDYYKESVFDKSWKPATMAVTINQETGLEITPRDISYILYTHKKQGRKKKVTKGPVKEPVKKDKSQASSSNLMGSVISKNAEEEEKLQEKLKEDSKKRFDLS